MGPLAYSEVGNLMRAQYHSRELGGTSGPLTRISRPRPSIDRRGAVAAASRDASSCDVAIVGGGLGGLVAAHALRKANPNIDVKIFEQFPAFQKAGALLGVAPNSQKALYAIDSELLEQAIAVSVADGKSIHHNEKGDVVREGTTDAPMAPIDKEVLERKHEGQRLAPLRLGWWELHQILAAAQPPGSVVFDSKFASYEESADEVMVQFRKVKDHEEREVGRSVRAKLLIGADGAFSNVRNQCLDDGKPKASGTVVWRARISTDQMTGLLDDGVIERTFAGDRRFSSVWLVNEDPREGCWVCGTNKDVLSEMGVDFDTEPGARTGYQVLPVGKSAHERVMKVMSGFPRRLTDIIAATDPGSVAEHGIWTRDVTERWGVGRVSLLGDAAHPMRPTTGQGFGQAAEDAHALATAVRDGGLDSESLRSYEESRWPRVAHIASTEQALATAAYQKDPGNSEKRMQLVWKRSNYQEYLLDHEMTPL